MAAPLAAINQDAVPVPPSAHRRRMRGEEPKLTLVADERSHASASRGVAAIGARRLDGKSRAWLDALHSGDPRRDEAIGRLHALLVREDGFEHARMWAVDAESPHELSVAKESAQTLGRLIAEGLTARQREVLIALTIDGVATEDLARRLNTTPGALYKTLHDARRKLKAGLAAA